jgi:hypothetical protein
VEASFEYVTGTDGVRIFRKHEYIPKVLGFRSKVQRVRPVRAFTGRNEAAVFLKKVETCEKRRKRTAKSKEF